MKSHIPCRLGLEARVLATLTLSVGWSPKEIGNLGMKASFFSDKYTKSIDPEKCRVSQPSHLREFTS